MFTAESLPITVTTQSNANRLWDHF